MCLLPWGGQEDKLSDIELFFPGMWMADKTSSFDKREEFAKLHLKGMAFPFLEIYTAMILLSGRTCICLPTKGQRFELIYWKDLQTVNSSNVYDQAGYCHRQSSKIGMAWKRGFPSAWAISLFLAPKIEVGGREPENNASLFLTLFKDILSGCRCQVSISMDEEPGISHPEPVRYLSGIWWPDYAILNRQVMAIRCQE